MMCLPTGIRLPSLFDRIRGYPNVAHRGVLSLNNDAETLKKHIVMEYPELSIYRQLVVVGTKGTVNAL